jgi:lysophospholipase L1-like esterase
MFPVYAWQGIQLRRRIERLLPAYLPHSGQLGDGDPAYKILTLGDSTVASVGMDKLEHTLTFNIAKAVHDKTGKTTAWRSAGGNSATADQVRDFILPHIEDRDFTHVVIAVGTNDMKNFHAIPTFKKNFGTLLYAVRTRFPGAKIIWTPVADMTKFPALPNGLAKVLSYRADLINAKGKQLCAERGAIYSEPIPIEGAAGFARDGFHAGPDGYKTFGEHLSGYILGEKP